MRQCDREDRTKDEREWGQGPKRDCLCGAKANDCRRCGKAEPGRRVTVRGRRCDRRNGRSRRDGGRKVGPAYERSRRAARRVRARDGERRVGRVPAAGGARSVGSFGWKAVQRNSRVDPEQVLRAGVAVGRRAGRQGRTLGEVVEVQVARIRIGRSVGKAVRIALVVA